MTLAPAPPPHYATIIAGSRSLTDHALADAAVAACGWTISRVLSGKARGADHLGECWARRNGVPVEPYPAKWEAFGRGAGHRRNEIMAQSAQALIALWDGKSPGTAHMIETARRRCLPVHVHRVER